MLNNRDKMHLFENHLIETVRTLSDDDAALARLDLMLRRNIERIQSSRYAIKQKEWLEKAGGKV